MDRARHFAHLSVAVHLKMQDCKKDWGLDLQSQVVKLIDGKNAIHFGTRIVDLECNSIKKDFTDAWRWPLPT